MSMSQKIISAPANEQNVFIARFLEEFEEYMTDPDISEICVNRPGEIWIERMGSPVMECIQNNNVGNEQLMRLARMIASETGQAINPEKPLLSASLPSGERIQVTTPPVSPNGIAISIRKQTLKDLSLDDYEKLGAFDDVDLITDYEISADDEELRTLSNKGDYKNFLSQATKLKKNIIISGGTSTGKTTLLNAVLKEVDENERIITIEDTAEVKPHHKNHLSLLASKGGQNVSNITIADLLETSLRLRPDRILLGELRGKEAFAFLRAVNTGHPGSITTVHADTPSGAIEQIALMVMQAGTGLEHDQIITYIRSIVDIVIQLKRIGGKRVISGVLYPGTE